MLRFWLKFASKIPAMDTIVIKTNNSAKAKHLVELLKSMDFVAQVEYLDKFVLGQKLLDKVNKIVANSELAEMTLEQVNEEISNYRNGK